MRKGGLWQRIFGGVSPRHQTPDLRDLITVAGVVVFRGASQIVRTLIQEGNFPHVLGTNPDSFNATAMDIVLDLTALNIHLVERIAGATLDTDTRSRFMDQLLNDVSESLARSILTDRSKPARRAFEDHFVSTYQERSQLYTPLPHTTGPGGIFWEPAAMIANTYFPNDVHRVALLLPLSIMASYAELNAALRPGLAAAGETQPT